MSPARVGIVARTATYAPLYALGASVQLVELGSTAAGVTALVCGDIDVAATCPDALIASDAPLRIASGLVDAPPTRIVAAVSVRDLADLRGRRIGTTAAQGSVSIFLRAVLRRHGLERGDYAELVCGPTPLQAAALERGEIDAAMLTAPFDARLAERGFRVLADVGAELGRCAFTTLNVRAGWTADERWRSLASVLARSMARTPGPIRYASDVDPASVARLVGLMREDGIHVGRDVGELIEGAAPLRASRSP